MSTNNFDEDMLFSKKYRYLLQILYRQYYYDGRYVFIDKSRFSTLVQKRLKTDVVAQVDAEMSCGIEEKVVRWPSTNKLLTAFFLETHSCTNSGYESKGWMYDGQADYLLYAFEIKDRGLDVYIMDFQLLKKWFWEVAAHNQRYPTYRMKQGNRTEGRLVDINHVITNVPTIRFFISFDRQCQQIDLHVNILSPTPYLMFSNAIEIDDHENENEYNWKEVQQRVEEILAKQEEESLLEWIDEEEHKRKQD